MMCSKNVIGSSVVKFAEKITTGEGMDDESVVRNKKRCRGYKNIFIRYNQKGFSLKIFVI